MSDFFTNESSSVFDYWTARLFWLRRGGGRGKPLPYDTMTRALIVASAKTWPGVNNSSVEAELC